MQRAAAAIYSAEGMEQTRALADFYLGNARLIREALTQLGFPCVGGANAPYIWANVGRDSWAFFDLLLTKAGVVCTPGAGFGRCGEGHVRISAFNSRENVVAALERIASRAEVGRPSCLPKWRGLSKRADSVLRTSRPTDPRNSGPAYGSASRGWNALASCTQKRVTISQPNRRS